MIDLAKFAVEKEVVLPIVEGWGQYEGRKVYKPNLEDAWYEVKLGTKVDVLRRASPLSVVRALQKVPGFKGYALGEEIVPHNFDNFFKRGFGETVKVFFLSARLFEKVKVSLWEDGRFYFYETTIDRENNTVQRVRDAFAKEEEIANTPKVTPELRYAFLVGCLQRQSIRVADEIERIRISDEERRKRVAEFNRTFPGRLKNVVERAGGRLVRFSSHGAGYLVEWTIGGQVVKSHIRDDMRIINAGFCLSGDDKKHSMNSIINLAKLFQEDAPLYITRE